MRYVFIINPTAGKKDISVEFEQRLKAYFAQNPAPYTCYVTKYAGEGTVLAQKEASVGDEVRIYGVGGDGTLLEIAQGARGHLNAEVGIFPYGSGNDYIRTYGGVKEDYQNLEKQLHASSKTVDMLRADNRCALNICSLGIDAEIAAQMVKYKKLPLVSGSTAYNLALVKCFLSKIGTDLRVVIDGEKELTGCFMFALAACGQYYGGGYHGAPQAIPDDGLLDFVLVRKPKLQYIPKMVSIYKNGKHLTDPLFKGLLEFCRGTKMEIYPKHPASCNCDGECVTVEKVTFSIDKAALRFIVVNHAE